MALSVLVAGLSFIASRAVLPRVAGVAVQRPAPIYLCDAAETAEKLVFDEALAGMMAAAESAGSLQPVLDIWLDRVDDMFVPTLASRLEAVSSQETPDAGEVARLSALLGAIERRSLEKFSEARQQLQDLLGAGEINAMDSKLCQMIAKRKLDAGFLYVLHRNMDDARGEVRKPTADSTFLRWFSNAQPLAAPAPAFLLRPWSDQPRYPRSRTRPFQRRSRLVPSLIRPSVGG